MQKTCHFTHLRILQLKLQTDSSMSQCFPDRGAQTCNRLEYFRYFSFVGSIDAYLHTCSDLAGRRCISSSSRYNPYIPQSRVSYDPFKGNLDVLTSNPRESGELRVTKGRLLWLGLFTGLVRILSPPGTADFVRSALVMCYCHIPV